MDDSPTGRAVPRREPTLADVAKEAGVSLTTVSRVLNNRGYLSQATKDRVAEAMKTLAYRPNQVARALHGRSTHTVGVIVPTVALPFFGELAANLEDALAEHGYRILLCNSLGRAEREREYLGLLVSHRVDGIICGAHNDDLPEYRSIRLPLVTIDRDLTPSIPTVRCDNFDGGRQATAYLLARGAARPALLTSRSGPHNRREAGYRSVLKAAGIEALVLTADFHTPEAEREALIFSRLDSAAGRFDSVFATDDLSAATVLDWASQRDLAVPEDLKVVGFDGTLAMRRALPGLTTIAQPIADIARAAVEVLLPLMEPAAAPDGDSSQAVVAGDGEATVVELPGTLIPGRTC